MSRIRTPGRLRAAAAPGRTRLLAAPVLAAVLAGLVAAEPALAGASSPPRLPARSTATLVQDVLSASPTNLHGTIATVANLGLSSLGSALGSVGPRGSQVPAILTGPTKEEVWMGSPGELRIAIPSGSQETDVVARKGSLWVWSSHEQKATHVVAPAGGPPSWLAAAGRHSAAKVEQAVGSVTPQSLATRLLGALGPSTRVFVNGTVRVAGHPAYELVLAPRSTDSLVADVDIAIDAKTGLPLQVQVLATQQSLPSFQIGFTSLHFAAQPARYFSFTPPAGAKVASHSLSWPSGPPTMPAGPAPSAASGGATILGSGWDTVAALPALQLTSPTARTLLSGARSVSGQGWSGRLVTTSLVDAVVVTSGPASGRVLVGAVQPKVLEADAAQLSQR
ncbi:MAG: LolA family protein [Acidimicrobiales bacterium]